MLIESLEALVPWEEVSGGYDSRYHLVGIHSEKRWVDGLGALGPQLSAMASSFEQFIPDVMLF